jgi:hypothetical protein
VKHLYDEKKVLINSDGQSFQQKKRQSDLTSSQ